jgi:hypothetical protein
MLAPLAFLFNKQQGNIFGYSTPFMTRLHVGHPSYFRQHFGHLSSNYVDLATCWPLKLFYLKTTSQHFSNPYMTRQQVCSSSSFRQHVGHLKGPKHEIFESGFFTQIRRLWLGDLGTGEKKWTFESWSHYFKVFAANFLLSIRSACT